jgi:methionine synthase II (cobalamin-independent)
LIDATRVVIHTQEQAGIDLVCDGELSRFDVNHPETNGMIEYFVRPMKGIRTTVTLAQCDADVAVAMNRVLDRVKSVPAVHLCFGNYGGQTVQQGTWAKLIDYLNALHVDHIVMETAHRPPEELAVFRELRPEIGFGLGVVDIKSTVIETADTIARRIEQAETTLGAGRVTYIHPDCGFWMLKRGIADGKIRALVAGRDLYEGRN